MVPVEIQSDNSAEDNRPDIRALRIIPKSGTLLKETLGSLMESHSFSRMEQERTGRANILGVPIQTSVGDDIKRIDNIYDLVEKVHKALSSTSYTGKIVKKVSDSLMMNNIINNIGYTGISMKNQNAKISL